MKLSIYASMYNLDAVYLEESCPFLFLKDVTDKEKYISFREQQPLTPVSDLRY
jgi:hypothetical protein